MHLSLSQRLSAVFCLLLLVCCGVLALLQVRASALHEQEVVQRLSHGLAEHIAQNSALVEQEKWNQRSVRDLFGKLMAVNPSVEVYLLDDRGRIIGHDAPDGHLKRTRVDIAPIARFLRGDSLPIAGDDPRSANGVKVFSAAPVKVRGHDMGYVYVILLGEQRDVLVAKLSASTNLRTTLWSIALVAVMGLLAGVVAFRWITRPLRELTERIRRFDVESETPPPVPDAGTPKLRSGERDEIAILDHALTHLSLRIGEQWRELSRQDQERREMIANISHDLRTPLSSMHGFLETLVLKDGTLDGLERRRYLDIALAQSRKVSHLAQELFELARLEHGAVKLDMETFSLQDVVQDVLQKFELAAEARQQSLVAEVEPGMSTVVADIGLVERVLTNLIDNAIRHSPAGGRIVVRLNPVPGKVAVLIADEGPGLPQDVRENLSHPQSALRPGRRGGGGLGLLIVRQILQLHGSRIEFGSESGGAVLRFELQAQLSAGGHQR